MASLGGWIRLLIGLLLSVEVLKIGIFNGEIGQYANMLSIAYILLTTAYFIFKF